MLPPRTRTLAALLVAAAALAPAGARAQAAPDRQKTAAAQALFDEAIGLMKQARYGDACPKLARSQEMDPGMGTQYRLAECYELLGRVATAWSLYREVADAARAAHRSDREAQALRHAEALAARVPRVTVAVPGAVADTPGLEVRRDGEPVDRAQWGRDLPTDPGPHLYSARAPGRAAWERQVTVAEAGRVSVAVPALVVVAPLPEAPAPAEVPAGPGFPRQRVVALAVGGLGVLGLAVGAAYGVMAKSKWSETLTHCQGGALDKCDPTGISLGSAASTDATASTVGIVVGGAAVAAAAVLFFTVPRASQTARSLVIVPAGPGIAAVGTF
jgi:hypothetical protein